MCVVWNKNIRLVTLELIPIGHKMWRCGALEANMKIVSLKMVFIQNSEAKHTDTEQRSALRMCT